MAKAKKSKADIKVAFATQECASSFALTLENKFPNSSFEQTDTTISVWASKKTLTKIRLESEESCYCRRSISIYTPC